ncbi:14595_t:CDS:1, partial [Dentiscutata erythropus]
KSANVGHIHYQGEVGVDELKCSLLGLVKRFLDTTIKMKCSVFVSTIDVK